MAEGAGKISSELDDIRPASWPPQWTTELLDLIWVLEATVKLLPDLNDLLDTTIAGKLFNESKLPSPSSSERKAPVILTKAPQQGSFPVVSLATATRRRSRTLDDMRVLVYDDDNTRKPLHSGRLFVIYFT